MTETFRVDDFSKDEWQGVCSGFEFYNLYQTWEYAALHSPRGLMRDASRCGLFVNGNPACLAQLRIKRIPLSNHGIAELEWGPLWKVNEYPHSRDSLGHFLRRIKEEYCMKRGLMIHCYPCSTFPYNFDRDIDNLFIENGFLQRETPTRHYNTVFIDLSQSEEQIRGQFHSSWRRHLRKAEKANLKMESGNSVEYFDRFYLLYKKMHRLKPFSTGIRISVIRRMQEVLSTNRRFFVAIACKEGKDIAALVCYMTGQNMLYLLGASDPHNRESSPGYLIHWYNIIHGKRHGYRWYDLGGLVGAGVIQFKLGMGGKVVSFPGLFEAFPAKGRPILFHYAESGVKFARSLLRRN